ncbi:transcription initiation factor TFIID subunit 12 isoform X1 [Elaeis guineensis]|uniref:Transcription initiation factor TFIID subunit 12 isoform X1 n=1 Tax=Elaeis guineensis var. tenera TaxID=51953 RepID=A0A6I9QJ64_ELAGV|nr:transcription initiation factor TFIID subunit 12 isoform X1 [Elaeis guineensis]
MDPPPPPVASSDPPPPAAAPTSQVAQPPSPAPTPAQPPPSSTLSTPAEALTPPASSSSAPSPTQNPSTPPQPLSQPQPPPQQQSQSQPPSIQPQQRPPLNRSRPQTPYPHFAHHLPSAPTSSSGPPSSLASPSPSPAPMQRGGLAIGVPAHNPHHPRPQQPPLSFSTFSPSPPFSQPFSSMPRVPEQSPTSSSQVRQPVQGIQNIGMIGALSAAGSQIRPSGMSGSQQQRFGQPPLRSASPSANQTLNSQKFPSHGLPRTPSMASPSSPSPVPQSPQSLQQPLSSAQGKQMHAPSIPSSSYRPPVKPHVLQQRPHHLQQHQHSLQTTSHQQQTPSSQQQQQQKQQQLQQQQQQQQASLSHQSLEHHNQQYLALRNQQPVTQQQQALRALGSTVQKSNSPGQGHSGVVQSGNISLAVNTDDAESGNQILSKRSLRELVAQIDPSEKLDSEVEDVLVEVAEDFIESVTTFACSLAKHRKSSTLEAKDILLHVERNWNMTLPGFSGDEIKCYKKQFTNDIHKERLAVIKKSMVGTSDAGNAKNPAAGQAASNLKAHAPKAPAIGSPKTH